MEGVPAAAVPWSSVWGRLKDIELDRQHRVLAWRILHGSVFCGAFRLYLHRTDALGAACPHVACGAAMQTMSHMFLECPVAQGVWHWVRQLWLSVAGDSPPPVSAAVLLADDWSAWAPPARLRPLWVRLRLTVLHALWCASAKARSQRVHVDARTVAASVMVACKRLMRRHWYRVDMSSSTLGSCPHWMSGRMVALTLQQFEDWWAAPGVLCSVHGTAGELRKLGIHWTTAAPVPLPPPSAPGPPPAEQRVVVLDDGDVDLAADWDLGDIDTFD